MSGDDAPRRILRSAGAATASAVARAVIIYAVQVALRHLVPAEDWGLWVWAQSVFLVLAAARDMGLAAHVLRLQPRPFGNLLRVQAVLGSSLTLAAFLGAPLLARAFADDSALVVPVLQALCIYLFLEGLAQVPLVYFEGELKVERALLPEVARHVTFAALSITLAVLGYGVWSFVVAHVGSTALFAALMWARAWGEIPLTFLPRQSARLYAQSVPLGMVWVLTLLTRNVDRLVLGARFPSEVVGTYDFGYWLAFLVAYNLAHPLGRAVYPSLVGVVTDGERSFEIYRLATLVLMAVEVLTTFVLLLNAELVVRVLGGEGWEGAPAYLRVLALAPLVDPLSRFGGQFFAARHQERLWLLSLGVTLLSFVGAGILLTGVMGPMGMAVANFLPLGSLVAAWGLHRTAPAPFRRTLLDLAGLYLLPLPFFAAAWLAAPGAPLLRAALSAVAAGATAGLYIYRYGHLFRAFFRRDRVGTPGTDGPPR